ncbi:MAG: dihydroorotate dehydrogenase-like protein [Desulfobulbus sp.]
MHNGDTMPDLSTTYLGLSLRNPLLVGSCGLTGSLNSIKELAENGAGAIVLKSLFEEQIQAEYSHNLAHYNSDHPASLDYIRQYTRNSAVDGYLRLIADAKKAVSVPIIASINCISDKEWISFARSVESQGADALELNISLLPSNPDRSAQENENIYFDILEKVRLQVTIPIVLKMSRYSSTLANLVARLSWTDKVDGFVLFNRYYRPDIDIESMTIKAADIFSSPLESIETLRWIALLSRATDRDLAASTGIHDSEGLIKQLLAGATAVEVVSTLYQNGPQQITRMLEGLNQWMVAHSFENIEAFRGILSYQKTENPAAYERIQFMKQYGGIV